ncbi:MAG: dickkopf-related protein [Myxococcaceae bacterium]
MRRAVILLAAAVGSGCVTSGRYYQLPLTTSEAPLVFPALASTAQGMGLESSQSADRVNVTLEDGTGLVWVNGPPAFRLLINLDESAVAADQLDVKYREVKVRADQIWQLAIEARQKNSVGAAVLVTPPGGGSNGNQVVMPASQRAATSHRAPVPAAGSRSASSCRSSLDCGSGQFCKDRGDGAMACMGGGGAGAPCTSGIDCGSGQFCKDHGSLKVCMGNGGPGDPCASGIDCGSGLFCRRGACAD